MSDAPNANKTAAAALPRQAGTLASFSWLSVGVMASRLLQFGTIVYLTRVLGEAAFGRFSFATAFVWYGVILADFGLSTIGTRDLARNPDRLGQLAPTIAILRLAVFAIEMVLVLATASLLKVDTQMYWLLVYSFLSVLAYAINTDWIFRGFQRMQYVAAWEALPRLVWLAGSIWLVHSAADLLRVPLLRAGGEIAVTLLLLAAAWWRFPASRPNAGSFHPPAVRTLLKEAAPIGLAALLVQIYYGFDTILLGILKTDAIVGWYSAAYRVVTLLMTGAFLLGATYQPILARAFATDRTGFAAHLRRLTAAALLLGLILPAAMAIGAPLVVRLLYGQTFAPAALPLAILMASMPFAYMGIAYSTALVAAGEQRRMLVGAAVAAISNIAINLVLIPPFGMVGAAIATVVSYAAAWLVQWWYVHSRICRGEPLPLGAVVEAIRDVPRLIGRIGRK